jgi:hypothetical protein
MAAANPLSILFEIERTAGARFHTERAFGAGRFANGAILECGHPTIDPAVGKTEGADFGHFPADPDAAAAEKAAAAVKSKGCGAFVNLHLLLQRRQLEKLHLQSSFLRYLQQLAAFSPGAAAAAEAMVAEEQLKSSLDQMIDLRAARLHGKTLFDRQRTCCDRFSPALHLDITEAATARGMLFLPDCTEIGDIDPVIQSRPEQLLPFGSFYLTAVYDYSYRFAHELFFLSFSSSNQGGDSLITAL